MTEHEHVFGFWRQENEGALRLWQRDCRYEGCEWRQVSSTDPFIDSPLDTALGRLAGIDRPRPIDLLHRAVTDPGVRPARHFTTLARHRDEWPTLWKAIDALLADADSPLPEPPT